MRDKKEIKGGRGNEERRRHGRRRQEKEEGPKNEEEKERLNSIVTCMTVSMAHIEMY